MLRNKLRYLFLIATMGILSVLYNKYYTGIIFLTIAVLPFILFGLICYIYGKIEVELTSAVHITNKGEQIPISIQINNPTIFPLPNLKLYLTYKNAFSTRKYKRAIMVSLDHKANTSVLCHFNSRYTGNMEIVLEGIRLFDYLKLFSLKKRFFKETRVAVLPFYYDILEGNIVSKSTQLIESDNYSHTKKGDDPSEVFAIREYREGDRLQRIHWKLSRKADQLMIKEFSDPANCSILLFINFSIPKEVSVLAFMDAIIECALSFSFHFLNVGQLHYISWYDEKHRICRRVCVKEEKDFFEAIDGLLQACPYTQTADSLYAYQAEHPHDQYTDLLFITGEVTDSCADALAIQKSHVKQVIYMRDANCQSALQYDSPQILKKYEDLGMGLYPVDINNIKNGMEELSLG